MQLAIADIVGIVLMICAAGSRLLPLTETWWNKLPDKLQPVIPALLLWLPQLADLAGVATTKLDLIEMVMLTLAALTPGAHTRTRLGAKTPEVRASHRPPPPDGGSKTGSGKGTRIMFPVLAVLSLVTSFSLLAGCSAVKDVVWPTVAKCAPAPKQIVSDVIDVLKSDPGGSLTDRGMNLLEELARKHGESVIACAIADVADRMSGTDDPNELRMRAKAKDFFEATQVVTE